MRFNNVRLKDQYDQSYSRNTLCTLNLISTFYYEYANYQLHAWKYFGFKIVNINGRETTKEQTVCKICVNDVSYNTGNMLTHLRRKHGIIHHTRAKHKLHATEITSMQVEMYCIFDCKRS